jgi:hypothetical protein
MSRRVCGVAYHEDSLEPENEVEQLLCKKVLDDFISTSH